jgi:hypothetical protein
MLPKWETPCFNFNKSHNGCKMSCCGFAHFCAVCNSSNHGWYTCKRRFFCVEHARDRCHRGRACKDRHWCFLCHGCHVDNQERCNLIYGRVPEPNFPFSYCFDWNAKGCCIEKLCHFRHECLYCGSATHGSADCVHSLVVLINVDFGGILVDDWHYRK